MMFNIYLPVVIGAVMLILAKPIGVAFLSLGQGKLKNADIRQD